MPEAGLFVAPHGEIDREVFQLFAEHPDEFAGVGALRFAFVDGHRFDQVTVSCFSHDKPPEF
ncbi:MAG: hypothetical protein A2Z76_00410 [Chloroflexi bacterium RBG_13_56_8b]|nr:MAG: hypothetical protein A2Z76_00410 [Chloroflexi bacterium RBG_13_56_8b]